MTVVRLNVCASFFFHWDRKYKGQEIIKEIYYSAAMYVYVLFSCNIALWIAQSLTEITTVGMKFCTCMHGYPWLFLLCHHECNNFVDDLKKCLKFVLNLCIQQGFAKQEQTVIQKKLCVYTHLHLSLTKEGIGKPVPLAALLSNQPSPVQTRGKTEGCPESAHEDVAQTDVQQDEIDGRPEGAKLCEDEKNEEVAQDPRH